MSNSVRKFNELHKFMNFSWKSFRWLRQLCGKNSDQLPVLNRLTDIFAIGKFDYGVMVRYQNLTRKPELFRAPLGTGPGTMYPLNPPLAGPACKAGISAWWLGKCSKFNSKETQIYRKTYKMVESYAGASSSKTPLLFARYKKIEIL